MDHAREGRSTLAALWEAPVEDLARIVRLHPRAAAVLQQEAAQRWTEAGRDSEEVRARGVDLLLPAEPDYPAALRAAPGGRRRPLVFAYGALGLLEEPRVTLASSKTVSNWGLAATDALADALARRDVPLVTSTTREAYKATAIASKRHAGPSLMVLDRGIAEAFPSGLDREPIAPARVWDEAFDPDLQLLLSPFAWRERWNPRSGPRRDALIFDLADVILAVDLRSGGTMDRECRAALRRGKRVLVLDRGPETDEGTRRLWEEETGATRVPWTSGEEIAAQVLAALPGERLATDGDRLQDGWQREVGQFLARACSVVGGSRSRSVRESVGVYPASGALAQVTAAWSARNADTTSGLGWLLADLASEGAPPPTRLLQLLERVARGGLLAAVVPAAWLEEEEFAPARAAWLERAALRLAARLPVFPVAASARAVTPAAIILERDGRKGEQAPAFSPGREQMGRFHLRRYLREVLDVLAAGR
jgi:predicted Rossmann fold nucleotide-binding protein DprA/Smf involved in DNA uptake